MPNHVLNIMILSGEEKDIAKLRESIKGVDDDGEEMPIDFDKIMPMPKDLRIDSVHSGIISAAKWALKEINLEPRYPGDMNDMSTVINAMETQNAFKEKSPLEFSDEDWDVFIQVLQNYKKHGVGYWYDWTRANWDTKWNAYSQREEDGTIRFDTAWSTPCKVIQKLSKQHPEVKIEIHYADEDTGCNCGMYVFKNGKQTMHYEPDYDDRKASVKYALSVRGITDPDIIREHGYDPKTFEYIEEE